MKVKRDLRMICPGEETENTNLLARPLRQDCIHYARLSFYTKLLTGILCMYVRFITVTTYPD